MNLKILAMASLLTLPMQSYAGAAMPPTSPPSVTIPANLTWHSFDAFPPGAEAAVISGHPRHAGPFVVLIRIPANYQVPPCWQTINLSVKLLSGSYHIGVGDVFDRKTAKTLPSSRSFTIPAQKHLFFWSPTGATFEVSGIGPWDLHYVNSAADPRNR